MKNNNLINVEDLVKEIITKSFPILQNISIKIVEKKKGKYSAIVRKDWGKYILYINRHYLNIYDINEVKGLLAHELSHIEEWVTKGILFYIINTLKCSFSKKFLEYHEKSIDKIAICKGYRRELKKQRMKREKIKDKNFYKNKRFYLTPKEIESFKI